MYRCNSTLSLTSALDDSQHHAPAALPSLKGHGTHLRGDGMGLETSTDGYRNPRPHRGADGNQSP